MLRNDLDRQLLDFAVQLELLPRGGSMIESDKIIDSDFQTSVVNWIEHSQENPPMRRTIGRIVYNPEAMDKMGLQPDDEEKAEELMKLFCKELRSGKIEGTETPLSTKDRISRLTFLSAMTGTAGFGANLKYPKKIYDLLNTLSELAQLGSEEQEKATRFLKLLDHLKLSDKTEEKIKRLEEVIQCIDTQRQTQNTDKDFFNACLDRIELQLPKDYKKHIKTLESELDNYRNYLKEFAHSQKSADVKTEITSRIKQCDTLIKICAETSSIEDRLKSIASGIKNLEKPLTHKVQGLPFEKPSEYGGLHSTFNAFLDLVAKIFPSVSSYKIIGLSSTKVFDTEETTKNIQSAFRKKM